MASQERGGGKPSRVTGGGQPAGRSKNTRRFCADCDIAGRIEIYTRKSSEETTALVYIFRDATGLSKIGFSQSLKTRIAQVHSTMPPALL